MKRRWKLAAAATMALATGALIAAAVLTGYTRPQTPGQPLGSASHMGSEQRTALLTGMFSGQITAISVCANLNSTGFAAGDLMTDGGCGVGRTLCVPGRNQDHLDTITLCGTNAPTPNPCVAADPNGTGTFDLFVEPCNAVGTLWTQDQTQGCPNIIVEFTNHHYAGRVIAMDGTTGDVAIARVPPIPGWYYHMAGVPPC